jgi:hypothetical protein
MFNFTKREKIEIIVGFVTITLLGVLKNKVLNKNVILHEIIITTSFLIMSKILSKCIMKEVDNQIIKKKKKKQK